MTLPVSIEFPLFKKRTALGEISSPVIPVSIRTINGLQSFPFFLDSGADFTIFPSYMKYLLGKAGVSQRSLMVYGMEGQGTTCSVVKIPLKIAHIEFDATCLISPSNEAPFILGRTDFFSRFNIMFDNKNEKIILTPL